MLKEIRVYPCLNDFTVPSIHCSKSAAENDSVTIVHLHCLLVLLRTAAQNRELGTVCGAGSDKYVWTPSDQTSTGKTSAALTLSV